MAKKKKKHIINWNIISIYLTVVVLIIGLFLGYNNKELSILHSELERVEKEKIELTQNTDPEWHIKFNNQKDFYESILDIKDSSLSHSTKINDSLTSLLKHSSILDSNQVIYTEKQDIRALNALMNQERYCEYICTIKEYIALRDSFIQEIFSELGNKELKISEYQNTIKKLSRKSTFINWSLIILMIISTIGAIMGYLKAKKNNS